jgi:protein disulfide-isomerase
MERLTADDSVPLGDRLDAVSPLIALSKAANGGKVTPAVLARVRERVAFADHAASNPMLRQAVMPTAGVMLDQAGDHDAAAKLLEKELPHAIAPYYFMIDLASMAEDRKDYKGAIAWARKAAETADGLATRIQWAIIYSGVVLRVAPTDKAAVEQSADAVIDALRRNDGGYAERTEKKVSDWADQMRDWSKKNGGQVLLDRLSARLAEACAKGDNCKNVLSKA